MIYILHISDFHFRSIKSEDFKSMSEKLCESLKNEKVDFVVFSGDLVCKGENVYEQASNILIEPLLSALHLPHERILIVPGNHDLDRNAEMSMVKDALKDKESIQDIDRFCEDKEQLSLSVKRFSDYNNFIKNFYEGCANIEMTSPLYMTVKFDVEGKKYGIVGLNSAWRCEESTKDRGNLIYPIGILREAVGKIKDCDFLMAAMHHNPKDFKDAIAQDFEDVVFENCHFLFSAHYHDVESSAYATSEIGLIHSVTPAIYNRNDKASTFGFALWEINEETYETRETLFYYVDKKFQRSDSVRNLSIPVSDQKYQQNKFRKVVRQRLEETKERADKDFVSGMQSENGRTFADLFKAPVIKEKSIEELMAVGKRGDNVQLTQLKDSDESILLFGCNKGGKTSILRKIQIDCFKSIFENHVIPYFINYREYRKTKDVNIKDELRTYLEKSKKGLDKLLQEYSILILIDDLDIKDTFFINNIKNRMAELPKSRLIACCDGGYTRPHITIELNGQPCKMLFIHSISEKEIHQLTQSWPNIPKERKYEAENKIVKLFRQMNMPFNFWTVSLFLWIFEKTDEQNIHNNFELVNYYIDELLDKTGFIRDVNINLDYDDLKSFLAALAKELYTNHDAYRMSEKELMEFTLAYREKNKKFSIDALAIIHLLIDKQVIEKTNELYTFRLNGVFEYFLAYRMKEDELFRNHVIENRTQFLSFGNELEFYAGFRKNDKDTIRKIFDTIKDLLTDITSEISYNEVDKKLDETFDLRTINKIAADNAMAMLDEVSDDERDELLYSPSPTPIDGTEVRIKTKTDLQAPADTARMEKSLFILGRVFRNSNICDEQHVANEIIEFLLTGSCNLGFRYTRNMDESIRNENRLKAFVQQITNIMPLVVEAFLHDAMNQANLDRILKEKFEELCNHPDDNEYKIFLLSLMLTDLNYKDLSHWDKALSIIRMKGLRFAMMNKLVLLRIQYSDNEFFIQSAKDRISKLVLEFDNNKGLMDVLEKDRNDKIAKKNLERISIKMDYKR